MKVANDFRRLQKENYNSVGNNTIPPNRGANFPVALIIGKKAHTHTHTHTDSLRLASVMGEQCG